MVYICCRCSLLEIVYIIIQNQSAREVNAKRIAGLLLCAQYDSGPMCFQYYYYLVRMHIVYLFHKCGIKYSAQITQFYTRSIQFTISERACVNVNGVYYLVFTGGFCVCFFLLYLYELSMFCTLFFIVEATSASASKRLLMAIKRLGIVVECIQSTLYNRRHGHQYIELTHSTVWFHSVYSQGRVNHSEMGVFIATGQSKSSVKSCNLQCGE